MIIGIEGNEVDVVAPACAKRKCFRLAYESVNGRQVLVCGTRQQVGCPRLKPNLEDYSK